MQYYSFGKYIKEKRLELGQSLNKFAIYVDVDSSIISRIENEKQDIKMQVLIKIAKGFGQTLGEFILEYESRNQK